MMAGLPVAALFRQQASTHQVAVLEAAKSVAKRLRTPAYLVGGAIRDLFLIDQLNDLDLTIEGDGIGFARHLAADLGGRLQIHERFLTALITTDTARVDVVTARSETYTEPATLPAVIPGTLRDDLYRRDFTVNAMAVSIWPDAMTELIDPFGGSRDMQTRCLQVLHHRSFRDDPTRILRGARQGTRLGLEFAAETSDLAAAAIATDAFEPLSADRLRHELVLLLEDAYPEKSLQRLDELGFYRILERSQPFTDADWQRLQAVIDLRTQVETVGSVPPATVRWWLSYLMSLGLSESPEERQALSKRLGFEEELSVDFRNLEERLQHAALQLEDPEMRPVAVATLVDRLSIEELMVLRATGPRQVGSTLDRWFEEWSLIRLEIGGHDLIQAGFRAGPEIGQALATTLDARREGRITASEELDFAVGLLTRENSDRE